MTEERPRPAAAARTWFDRHTPTFAARYRASRIHRFLTWALIVLLPLAVTLHLYGVVQKQRYDPRRQPADAVTLLVTARCPFSRELEAALQAAAVPYRRIDVEKDEGGAWAFHAVNARGVPVTVIGNEVVAGLRTNQLRVTLQRAGRDTSRLLFKRETDALPSVEAISTDVKP